MSAACQQLFHSSNNPLAELCWVEASERALWVSFVPFEENVEIECRDGIVTLSAKTSGAGPGYHEFVVDVLDHLEKVVGFHWFAGSDEGDETGYREHRDVERLRREMVRQVQAVAQYILEEDLRNVRLSMPIGSNPVARGFASSPMGEWSDEWLRAVVRADEEEALALAMEFFPWWEREVGIRELTNFGKVLCWTEVRWVVPQNEAEERPVRVAIECFERATRRGASGVPVGELGELRELVNGAEEEKKPEPEGIGYRRGDYEYPLPGGWTLTLPGYFHEQNEEDGVFVFWFGDRTVRTSGMKLNPPAPAEDLLRSVGKGDMTGLGGLQANLAGAFESRRDNADECFLTHVVLAVEGRIFTMTFAYDDQSDEEWALQVARSVRHTGDAEA